mmetsp:Transcript_35448/g.53308  ORF Transcript_35448/g.53308 Transcript_35448/m.53308 type:complete len:210 (+) Transcript_35448:165-794(+)|eukprot:CAMPEP_0194773478 /NCGR_PEP_ID=MMETSP0323_2-20130528/54975_1 /TAXON_ID=2866 ORGANISM="Crypthecodinium cohnii, Strain Seligo" /NCGR_SAMPLE_ID=MMETSP0323_2 /ASSEMBLY_ACC=CAM_ASM_000346 /LENGTH=209 /DNA_ID=CAMNT_0039708561 /DNA_START=142 /DNA_END=771 /DNA_ORIENTATION=+
MGFMGTAKFLALGARSKGRRVYFRKLMPAHKQWDLMKNMLNDLVKEQRIETTMPKAKELQQYAEEIVFLAKKNTPYHDGLVESILTSPEARSILYERMVPRYADRHFHYTRIVNEWRYRWRDAAPMAMIEYVDRPGELRPANPVGAARDQMVAQEFLETRRGRRRYTAEMGRMLSRNAPPPLDEEVLDRCIYEAEKLGVMKAPTESPHA